MYQALNVPISRLQPQTGLSFGRQVEVTRDELKFAKFINRLRNKFSDLFRDLLKTQLILKGVIVEQDWNEIKEAIRYKFAEDQYFKEAKDAEMMRNRVDLLNQVQPYVGTYYSQAYIRKNLLHLTDDEIDNIEKEIAAEPPPLIMQPGSGQINNQSTEQGQ
jgi:hypothetical protein